MSGSSTQPYKILQFGSGFTARAITDFYKNFDNFHITIASNDLKAGQEMAAMNPAMFKAVFVNVMNIETFEHLIQDCDIAISLIPATLHMKIAEVMIKHNKNLVTSSYVSPAMQSLDEQVRAKGLTFLNEIGLDPGIDHLATMSTIDHIKKKGGIVKQYYSFTGGQITPDCCDNPLGYKFTWAPASVFRALLGTARFLKDGEIHQIPNYELLHSAQKIHANKALNLVGFPNRDSTTYQKLYNLENVETFIRGTMRYNGFCEIAGSWVDLGLVSDQFPVPADRNTWWEQLLLCAQKLNLKLRPDPEQEIIDLIYQVADRNKLSRVDLLYLCKAMISHPWHKYTKTERFERMKTILEGYEWFDLLNVNTKVPKSQDANKPYSTLEALAYHTEKYLTMGKDEMDLIVMVHFFKVLYPKTNQVEVIKSSMVKSGTKDGLSAMALTVGTPVAIAVKMVLEGKINAKGVLRPTIPEIYEPVLEELKKRGIYCKDEVCKSIEVLPKL